MPTPIGFDPGNGTVWERMTTFIHKDFGPNPNGGPPSGRHRLLSIAGSIDGRLYVMGGQMNAEDDGTAQNDVYESSDGGATWRRMEVHVPWSPRGMVHGMPVIEGELYLVGGGRHMKTALFDGVFAFKPDRPEKDKQPPWRVVREDSQNRIPVFPDTAGWPTDANGNKSGRGYHNVVWTPGGPDEPHGIIWVITGSVEGIDSCKGILTSRDLGLTWRLEMDADWGIHGSHADGVTLWKGRIVRASGNAQDRSVYWISRELLVASYPEKPEVNGFLVAGKPIPVPVLDGQVGKVVTLTGDFSEGVSAVYVSAGVKDVVYTVFSPPTGTAPDQSLRVTIPAYPPYTGEKEVDVYIVVVGPGGSSKYWAAAFTYEKKK